jgi:hypothetical protein
MDFLRSGSGQLCLVHCVYFTISLPLIGGGSYDPEDQGDAVQIVGGQHIKQTRTKVT